MSKLEVEQPLELPNKITIKNRFFKSAMSETLADRNNSPTPLLVNLYNEWAKGGSGIVVTGNVMIDRQALGEPGNVVIDDERDLVTLKQWAKSGTVNHTHLWVQVNHPGKQSPRSLSKEPVAPSAIALNKKYKSFFNQPRELTTGEVKEIIQKFINTARIVKKAGFTGVQIHGAHGYLVSQFLSPVSNQREDEYGGSIENRMRFLIDIYTGMREALGTDFSISVKLNISDFSEGGFSEEEAVKVMMKLSDLGIDLIEISGGNYENPKMFNETDDEDVFFIEYAKKLKLKIKAPIVVTGGFRTLKTMEHALSEKQTTMIGLARPLVLYPDLPNQISKGKRTRIDTPRLTTGLSFLDKKAGGFIGISYYEQQIKRIAYGEKPVIHRNGWKPIISTLKSHGLTALMPRRTN
ncbi:MAG: NADH:flavin oxidoreductase/NADH oxidase family protein [Alkalibacterium sp.]|nr:NADH:flavin oxidoreductase/NADH oxidase family protein [Alkalibacterium sp.]